MVRDYSQVLANIEMAIEGEDDWIAILATVVCELHNSFEDFHWTGFYRVTGPGLLKVGPYQGGHGCLEITFDRGICGTCATTQETQLVENVHQREDHIACSSSTMSEIVVPVLAEDGKTLAVLDIDSDIEAAFDENDKVNLEALCAIIATHFR
ncbi:MAG: GAF domain-containing protein [Candidatus Poseidoniaceae archaeon]|jgi:GAF domain-containing protein|nr:GAF domain-containing protein [Candidatus Poseidoniaceae archaeon]